MPEIPNLTEEESFRRGIYPYTVAGEGRIGDPLKIMNRMYEACPAFDQYVNRFLTAPAEGETAEDAHRRNVETIEAATALEPAVLAGFGLQPLGPDGSGVSISESMTLLGSFLSWQTRRDLARQATEAESESAGPSVPEPEPATV